MHVTVEVVGDGSYDLELDPEDATYADLLAAVDLSRHEASVLVDGRPVPEDRRVAADRVTVLRLVKGGSGPGDDAGASGEDAGTGTRFASGRDRPDLGIADPDFELPNAGAGPDPLVLSELADDPDNDAVVVSFHRDYRCRTCRRQVREVADRYSEFRARDAAVVSVLPEPKPRAANWQQRYHLPFALVADEAKAVAARYGQPVRFGRLGRLHDLVGRMPETAILDARDGLRPYAVHRGDRPADRPSVDDVLGTVDRLLDG